MATAQLPAETTQQPAPLQVGGGPSLQTGYLVDTARFEHLWRVAKAFSASNLVPDTFKGKPQDCFIAAQLSLRLNCDLFMLMQNLYVVHGKPGFEAKLSIALLNASGKIEGTVRYRFDGDGDEYGCTAYVTDSHTGETVEGPKVDWRMVKGEKWNEAKKGIPSKWTTMPDQMFRYRAATYLIRAHYPEVLMGMQTRDEIEDSVVDVEATEPARSLDALADKLEAGTSGQADEPDAPAEAATDVEPDEEFRLGDEPTADQIKAREENYLARLSRVRTKASADSIEAEVSADPHASDDFRGRFMAAYREKVGQLNGG